ncbi:MAG: hypothetical protein J1F05_04575 [Muribaculaceae bacterium]|nr:hypothetical protein [Muribaculaceae bacterium]
MKRFNFMLIALTLGMLGSFAEANPTSSNSEVQASSQQVRIIYSGPAYSSANSDQIMKAGSSVSIRWTSDGCSVNGEDGYQPQLIRGGYPMYVNEKLKYMNYRVNYGGEWYYFQA